MNVHLGHLQGSPAMAKDLATTAPKDISKKILAKQAVHNVQA
jgi:hypothetical protein